MTWQRKASSRAFVYLIVVALLLLTMAGLRDQAVAAGPGSFDQASALPPRPSPLELALSPDGQANLTGVWNGNDGATYYLRQAGVVLWWVGMSAGGGQAFTNVYRGTRQGDTVTGEWADVPLGGTSGAGNLVLRIETGDRLTRTSQTGGFVGSVWTRGAGARVDSSDVYYDRGPGYQEDTGYQDSNRRAITLHACRPGYAMLGAHVDDNVFLCARVTNDTSTLQSMIDTGTQDPTNTMHACQRGMYMRGLHADRNWLLCSGPIRIDTTDYDGGPYGPPTQDPSNYMHVCPQRERSVTFQGPLIYMLGIHDDRNIFYCGYTRNE